MLIELGEMRRHVVSNFLALQGPRGSEDDEFGEQFNRFEGSGTGVRVETTFFAEESLGFIPDKRSV